MDMHVHFNLLLSYPLYYVYPRLASTVRELINHETLEKTRIGAFDALNLDYIVSFLPPIRE